MVMITMRITSPIRLQVKINGHSKLNSGATNFELNVVLSVLKDIHHIADIAVLGFSSVSDSICCIIYIIIYIHLFFVTAFDYSLSIAYL